MNAEQIAALLPGPDLDRLVHEHVFAKAGRRKPWSTTSAALEILDVLPVVVGRRNSGEPDYKPERPYWGGLVEPVHDEESGPHYVTNTRIFCATAPVAACKIALIEVFRRKQ